MEDKKYDKVTTSLLRYEFSEKETLELASKLATRNNDVKTLEEDKKRVTSDFKAKIDAASADISLLSSKVSNGYEYRDIKCGVKFHAPADGMKQLVRMDTGEVVATEEMNDIEKQAVLAFEEEEEEGES
jgi:outer membrane murein-binding lipoprotein Lpp